MKGRAILKRLRIVELIVVLAVAVFVGYQFFASYYYAITTESAFYFEYSEGVELYGTIIRNEHTLDMSRGGTLHYIVSDGERVAKGGVIAEVYSDDKASAAATRVAEIDKQLSAIEEIEGYNNVSAVDMNTVSSKAQKNLDDFLYITSSGRFGSAADLKGELLNSLIRKQVATGESSDFSAVKNSLNSEKAELISVMGSPKSKYTADYSGYFVSAADGLEEALSTEDLTVFTPEYMESVVKDSVSNETATGKIVSDYEWYIATTISLSDSVFYKNGESVKLKIHSANQTVNATVRQVNFSKDKDTATVVFSSSEMSGELALVRSSSITVIKNEYGGLRVSRKAIRNSDGVTGVYVISGLEVKFVAAEIIYSNEEYVICKLNTSDEEKLRLYDEVVVKGRGLYDGKIIY